MRNWALLAVAALLASHAQGACTGLNAGDTGVCPSEQCQAISTDFSDSSVLVAADSLKGDAPGPRFVSEQTPNYASVEGGRLALSLQKSSSGAGYDGSTVYYNRWIRYGTITATIKSGSLAPGIVSSLQLQDDKGSSLEMDWVGLSSNRLQTYVYTNSQVQLSQAYAPILQSSPTDNFITYKIVWLPESITWYVNNFAIRTLNRKDTWSEGEGRFKYPDNAARLSFAIWDASKSINPSMTTAWAGTIATHYPPGTKATMYVDSVSVECYSNATKTDTDKDQKATLTRQPPGSNGATNGSQQSAPAAGYDLSNFGLSSNAAASKSDAGSSALASASNGGSGDDVSKYLAANAKNSSPHGIQSLGLLTTSIVTLAVAFFSSI
ncbi:putative glycosidase CRH2 [Dipsacomyces acuminosporus]|nr:putative glycosidase CRH2 [Dipsacomyces acuminosporus]